MKSAGFLLTFLFYALAFLLGAIGTYSWLEKQFFVPIGGDDGTVYFEVDKNQTLKTIAQNLESQGIIRKWWTVYALNYLESSDRARRIFPGEYEFSRKQSAKEILEALLTGKVYYRKLTIPEGLTVADYPSMMAKTGLVSEDEAATAIYNSFLARSLGIPADTFEGYLFPETYNFTKPDNAEKMLQTMVQEGRKRIDSDIPDFIQRAVDIGLSPRQIITLASIIEKETSVPEERAIVSSVFHNRLRIGMPLQSDPTVIYGITEFDGNLTKDHLKDATNIFNTYQHTGMPPGPICNPGIEAIKAALFPADTDYLYFVATGEGGKHAFSASYAEHQKYVNQYQRNKSK